MATRPAKKPLGALNAVKAVKPAALTAVLPALLQVAQQTTLFDEPAPQGPVPMLEHQFDALPMPWREHLGDFIRSPWYERLCHFVDGERSIGKTIYPDDVFRALQLTPPDAVKVVILGQDPYHGDDRGIPQAHGLAFSVRRGVRPPPSLKNIFKEIGTGLGPAAPTHGCLDHWAKQGVLLLNTVLTVERERPASHAKHGWEQCTDTLIRELAQARDGLVFMLWGAHAQAKTMLLADNRHLVLEAPHPSPLSAHRGFLGCGHFAAANQHLQRTHRAPIDWRLPERTAADA